MKPFEIETELTKMVGKVVNYRKKNQQILRFEIKEKTVKIVTDVEDIVILVEDFKDALPHFLPAEAAPVSIVKVDDQEKNLPAAVQGNTTIIKSSAGVIFEALQDNIKRVQRDKEYIPQAVEVVNNVKAMIDLAKAEIELIKAMRNS